MREALRLVETASFDRADVIAISDGLTAINEAAEARDEGAAVLARIADTTLKLATLVDQQAIAEIFAI